MADAGAERRLILQQRELSKIGPMSAIGLNRASAILIAYARTPATLAGAFLNAGGDKWPSNAARIYKSGAPTIRRPLA